MPSPELVCSALREPGPPPAEMGDTHLGGSRRGKAVPSFCPLLSGFEKERKRAAPIEGGPPDALGVHEKKVDSRRRSKVICNALVSGLNVLGREL